MKKKPSFNKFQGHRPHAKSLVDKDLSDGKYLNSDMAMILNIERFQVDHTPGEKS